MEPIVLMNSKWGNDMFIPMYLFFGGLTGGLFIVAVLADLIGIKFKPFSVSSRITAYALLPVLALAGAFIVFHLGKPERGLLFPFFFSNFDSWMVIGGWAVGAAVPFVVGYAFLWYCQTNTQIFNITIPQILKNDLLRRTIGVIALPILGFVAVYTGLLLSGAMFVPLWSIDFLPYLFLNSGILTGLAGIGLFSIIYRFISTEQQEFSGVLSVIRYAILVMIAVELTELYLFFNYLATDLTKVVATGQFIAPNGGLLAYNYVINGVLAPWFWGGIIGLGLGVPLFLTLFEIFFNKFIKPYALWLALTKFSVIIVGGVILRFVIVWGGELKAPLPFPPQLFQIPITG